MTGFEVFDPDGGEHRPTHSLLAEMATAYGAAADIYISTFGAVEQTHEDDLDLIRRAAHPEIPFVLGSLPDVARPDRSWCAILAWYSLIHLRPSQLDDAFDDLRGAIADDGVLVTGCFTWDRVTAFDHKVLTAYRWPVDEFVRRLTRAGFVELERIERPAAGSLRAHAAVALHAARAA